MNALVLAFACNREQKEKEPEGGGVVEVDSTYFAMNPMDLEFDSKEMVMIDSGMADYIDAYRAIRAYGLPNSTPPALELKSRGPFLTEKNKQELDHFIN